MPPQLLDELMPTFDFREHHCRVVAAEPAAVRRAVLDVSLGEMPGVAALFAVRSLPKPWAGLSNDLSQPVLQQMLARRFTEVATDPDRGIAVGTIAQMWKPVRGIFPRVRDGADYLRFAEPGYAKALMTFTWSAHPAGTLLETETRVQPTDPGARRAFARYWRLIGPWSGLIRLMWLRAIAARAERADPGSAH